MVHFAILHNDISVLKVFRICAFDSFFIFSGCCPRIQSKYTNILFCNFGICFSSNQTTINSVSPEITMVSLRYMMVLL